MLKICVNIILTFAPSKLQTNFLQILNSHRILSKFKTRLGCTGHTLKANSESDREVDNRQKLKKCKSDFSTPKDTRRHPNPIRKIRKQARHDRCKI